MYVGKLFIGNKNPINIDFEKSGLGNKINPKNKPSKIAIYTFFSFILLL